MIQLPLVPLLMLVKGRAQPPHQVPDFGRAYSFTIPVSNPNNIRPVFKHTAGEIAPGIRLDESGLLEGESTCAGTFTFTFTVLWNDSALIHQDYSLKIATPKVQLLDWRAVGVNLLPTALALGAPLAAASPEPEIGHPSPVTPPVQRETPPSSETKPRNDGTPNTNKLMLDQPLTTASDPIEGISATNDDVTIKRRGVPVTQNVTLDATGDFSYAVPSSAPLIPGEAIEASVTLANSNEVCSVAITVQAVERIGKQARTALGFEQAGASAANSDQRFFFDLYIGRPLTLGANRSENSDALTRWWGKVRIACAPRQISSPFSANVQASSLKSLKVNELAESAEFLTGLDFGLGQICCALWRHSGTSKECLVLSFIVGGGATGRLTAGTSAGKRPALGHLPVRQCSAPPQRSKEPETVQHDRYLDDLASEDATNTPYVITPSDRESIASVSGPLGKGSQQSEYHDQNGK